MLELKPMPKPAMNEAGNQFEEFEEMKELNQAQTKKGAYVTGGMQSEENI